MVPISRQNWIIHIQMSLSFKLIVGTDKVHKLKNLKEPLVSFLGCSRSAISAHTQYLVWLFKYKLLHCKSQKTS